MTVTALGSRPPRSSLAALIAALAMGACGSSPSRARTAMPPPASVATTSGGEAADGSAGLAQAPASERAAAFAPGAFGTAPPPAPSGAARTLNGIVDAPRPRDANPTLTETASAPVSVPMLIYVAESWLVVERVTDSADRAVEIAVAAGGFLATRGDDQVQLRVPSARFREALSQLEHLGEVTHRQIAAEDVSEQFHDLEVQLANLRSVRARLDDFLHRAANMQEALTIERELERVTSQIDQIEGRMRFLGARAAFSTITLRFTRRAVVAVTPVATPDPGVALPFDWIHTIGLPHLLNLR